MKIDFFPRFCTSRVEKKYSTPRYVFYCKLYWERSPFSNVFDRHLLGPWDFFRCTKTLADVAFTRYFFLDLFIFCQREKNTVSLVIYRKRDHTVTRYKTFACPRKTIARFSRRIIFASPLAMRYLFLSHYDHQANDNRIKKKYTYASVCPKKKNQLIWKQAREQVLNTESYS